ncbi:MAG: chorismate synthase, partial [Clostridia bacterium]|nr:chorismate synthase [Clostridia bacterium]
MGGAWGKNIKLSIFGESHGKAIGIIVDGLPPGMELDLELIRQELNRRAPGKSDFSTTRREREKFEILSGFFEKKTTGTPLAVVIYNE